MTAHLLDVRDRPKSTSPNYLFSLVLKDRQMRGQPQTRMFDNVQTLSVGMGMLMIGLAPLIPLGLERYCQEGHEHG